MITITDRLTQTFNRIKLAAEKFQRSPEQICLLAVSKTKPNSDIVSAYNAGQRHFGENYVQEGVNKCLVLANECPDIRWHFIGPLQSNKTRDIAQNYHWVHTIDREKIARRLSDQRPPLHPNLNVCIQVNISGEASKSGVAPSEVVKLAQYIQQLPNITLRGLMAIPSNKDDIKLCHEFKQMQQLFEQLIHEYGTQIDTLSMGMSQDLELAIEHGSTIVRVGSAIFGSRAPK
ncbi:MAG: YggS family pyridoxal phosphate-dependent enzyme [Parashewanella sp.]